MAMLPKRKQGFEVWRCCCERIWLARASGHSNAASISGRPAMIASGKAAVALDAKVAKHRVKKFSFVTNMSP